MENPEPRVTPAAMDVTLGGENPTCVIIVFTANVEPGTYTARMQFRSITGTTVTLTRPTMVIHHR